ncbi:MAG: hypothetical protein JXA99_04365 [Candidatus Lokiarchaeota archaeon]|nr:hypothetical protein [Candidatus Lokiarchaeota archaeon]
MHETLNLIPNLQKRKIDLLLKYSIYFNPELDFCENYIKDIFFDKLNYEEILEIEKVIEKLKIKVLKRKLFFGEDSPV